jgi:hypothetical protein
MGNTAKETESMEQARRPSIMLDAVCTKKEPAALVASQAQYDRSNVRYGIASLRCRGSMFAPPSKSAIVRATFKMRSCARAESPSRVTAFFEPLFAFRRNRAMLANHLRHHLRVRASLLLVVGPFELPVSRDNHPLIGERKKEGRANPSTEGNKRPERAASEGPPLESQRPKRKKKGRMESAPQEVEKVSGGTAGLKAAPTDAFFTRRRP